MKKHPKIHNSIFILMLMLSILVFTGIESFAENTQPPMAAQKSVSEKQIAQDSSRVKTIPEKNAYELKKLANSQKPSGFKYTVFRFFLAMIGVFVSALAIFGGLKFYQKFVLKNNSKLDSVDFNTTLQSPKDFREAINLFLDKTDK